LTDDQYQPERGKRGEMSFGQRLTESRDLLSDLGRLGAIVASGSSRETLGGTSRGADLKTVEPRNVSKGKAV
jgi:hypothetical protein